VTEDEIYNRLNEVFRISFGNQSIALQPQTTAADINGWDSTRMILLILAVEAKFGIRIRNREVDALRSVGDFVKLIQAKTRA
jgi:acyl carrier protein